MGAITPTHSDVDLKEPIVPSVSSSGSAAAPVIPISSWATGNRLRRPGRAIEAPPGANHAAVDNLFSRPAAGGAGSPDGVPAPVVRGMENLKLALRLRLKRGPLDQTAAEAVAAALDAAAQAVERS